MCVPEDLQHAAACMSKARCSARRGYHCQRGAAWYPGARVTPVTPLPAPAVFPKLNDDGTVDVEFFVDAGKRAYVRRVNLQRVMRVTQDEVMRRELRQMEGGWASTSLIDLSKVRHGTAGFLQEVLTLKRRKCRARMIRSTLSLPWKSSRPAASQPRWGTPRARV